MQEENFNEEQKEKLKRYYKEDWFKELNELVNICDLDQNEEVILEHIKNYIKYFVKQREMTFSERVDMFIKALEAYSNKENIPFEKDEEGRIINLSKSGFTEENGFYMKDKKVELTAHKQLGLYYRNIYVSTDRKIYLVKIAMDNKGQISGYEKGIETEYNPVLAQNIFEYFEEPVAKYLVAKIEGFPNRIILTENFLQKNQELIHLCDFYELEKDEQDSSEEKDTHSSRLKLIENNLRIRYERQMGKDKFEELLGKIKLQYVRQEFMKKMLGPMDNNFGNSGLILTTTGNDMDIPEIDLSPAYDLDLSFNIAEEVEVSRTYTDNGKDDMESYIDEFKNVEGFRKFLDGIVEKMQDEDLPEKLVNDTYEKTGLEFLKINKENYVKYLKRKFKEVKDAYKKVYSEEKEVIEDDSRTILD